jgi:ribosomal protein L37AE/L43A
MIALRVFGEGRKWLGQVVAVAATDSDDWAPVKGPLKSARRPEYAAVAAIKAWEREQRPKRTCERCGFSWRLSIQTLATGRKVRRCPKCRNTWRKGARERGMKEAADLLRQTTGRAADEAAATRKRRP